MAELELQQIVCPSCRQVISSFNPFAAEVECPYCHTKSLNPLVSAKKIPYPERIIPFRTTENDFEQALIAALVARDYVPVDIFNYISAGDVIKVYLPMYLYEGRFNSSWSGQTSYTVTGTRYVGGGRVMPTTERRYVPQTGAAQGNFSILCLAYDGKDIPEELRVFSSQFPYNAISSQEFDPSLLELDSEDSPLTIPLNTDAEFIWNKFGDSYVNRLAQAKAMEQTQGKNVSGFSSSSSYSLNGKGRFVLAPFWFVYYTYKKEQYYFIMDGLGESTSMTAPENQEERKYIMKKTRQKSGSILWVLIPAIVIWLVSDWKTGLGSFVTFLILSFIINSSLDNKIKKRLAASREARRKGAFALYEENLPDNG